VINLISENTIKHRMLDTLSHKRALSDGVLDLKPEPLDASASFMVRFTARVSAHSRQSP
jgi:SNF2 family DNA or RNA helicase